MDNNQRKLEVYFGKDFLKDHAGRIMTDPNFALVELVANSWDAGADQVHIEVPGELGGMISILDNGTGMKKDEFLTRWKTLSYSRIKFQGRKVVFPEDRKSNRIAYGKNGKGRHAMFCFGESYYVETWQNGEFCKFEVKRTNGLFDIIEMDTKKIETAQKGHGTKIWAIVHKTLIKENDVFNLIGSKFITDPSFRVFVNDKLVTTSELEDLMKEFDVEIQPFGKIGVKLYDTLKSGRTSWQTGIAWWVNNRLVGNPSWKLAKESFIDRRKSEAKRYTIIIQADILQNEVLSDWSWFKENEKFKKVFMVISEKIIEILDEIFKSKRTERKRSVLIRNQILLKNLSSLSRDKIGKFIDDIQKNCPSLNENDLENLTQILINLESSETGYKLLQQIAEIPPSDIDHLSEILSKWTVLEAKTVLSDLKWRLDLIKELQLVVEKKSDELHELQPIFERALWIFGPEYDAAQFTSNKEMTTVIKRFFNNGFPGRIRDRPDFVVLQDSSLGIYATNQYSKRGVVDFRKVVIIELKRGQSIITQEEMNQAMNYISILRKNASIPNAEITAYIIGSKVEEYIEETVSGKNSFIVPMTYNIILENAHARTFNLIEKIKKEKKIQDQDSEIKDIMAQTQLDEF